MTHKIRLYLLLGIVLSILISSINAQEVSIISLENVAQIEELLSVQVDTRSLRTVLFSPDSQSFVTLKRYDASMDNWSQGERQEWLDSALEVRNTQNSEIQFRLKGHTDKITLLEFQPEGNLLASASEDGTIRLWDVSTGDQMWLAEAQGNLLSDLSFSSDGQWLAFVDGSTFPDSQSNQIRLMNIGTLQELESLDQPFVFLTIFSPDNRNLVAAGSDGNVRIWHVNNYNQIEFTDIFGTGTGIPIIDVTFSHNGELIAIDDVINLNIWNISNNEYQHTYTNHVDIDFARRRYSNVFAQSNNGFVLFDISTDQLLARWESLESMGAARAINQEETILISTNQNTLQLWDTSNGEKITSLHHDDVFDASFSVDSSYIASWSASSGLLKIWGIPAK